MLYVTFALILIGIPGLSRGGIVSVLFAALWLLYGVLFKQRVFPAILYLPLAFYFVIVAFGFILYEYPVEPVGKLTTAWIGGITIAAFVANGVSLRFVVSCFFAVIVANLLAYAVGYDGRVLHVLSERDNFYHQHTEIKRFTALAGQSNLLVAFAFTFPFLLFLFKKRFGANILIGCTTLCVVFMFLTASRSTLPFTFLYFIFGCLFFIKTPWFRAFTCAAGVVILSIFAYIILSFSVVDILTNSFISNSEFIIRIVEALNRESGSIETRVGLATGFGRFFVEHPFMGYGPDQFKVVAGNGSYAHNNFGELLINYGLIGSLIYYSMYLLILIRIIEFSRSNFYLIAPLLYLIASEFVFVTHVERPLVLLLCLLLLISNHSKLTSYRYRYRL